MSLNNFFLILMCCSTSSMAQAIKSCVPETLIVPVGQRVELSSVITIKGRQHIKNIRKLQSKLTWNYSSKDNYTLPISKFNSSVQIAFEDLAYIRSTVVIPIARKSYDEGRYTCILPYGSKVFAEECLDLQIDERQQILGCTQKIVNRSEKQPVELFSVTIIENPLYIKKINKLRSGLSWNYSGKYNQTLNFNSSIGMVSENLAFINSSIRIPRAEEPEGTYTRQLFYGPNLFAEECFDLQFGQRQACIPDIAIAKEFFLVKFSTEIAIENRENIKNIEVLRSSLTWTYSGENNRTLNYRSSIRTVSEDLAFIKSILVIDRANKSQDEGIYTLKVFNGRYLFAEACFYLQIGKNEKLFEYLCYYTACICLIVAYVIHFINTTLSTPIRAGMRIFLRLTMHFIPVWFLRLILPDISNFADINERIELQTSRIEPAQHDIEMEEITVALI